MLSEDCSLLAFVNPSGGFHTSRRGRVELKRFSRSKLQAGILFKDIPHTVWPTLILGFQRVSNTNAIIKESAITREIVVSVHFGLPIESWMTNSAWTIFHWKVKFHQNWTFLRYMSIAMKFKKGVSWNTDFLLPWFVKQILFTFLVCFDNVGTVFLWQGKNIWVLLSHFNSFCLDVILYSVLNLIVLSIWYGITCFTIMEIICFHISKSFFFPACPLDWKFHFPTYFSMSYPWSHCLSFLLSSVLLNRNRLEEF